jgi:hypothetical protein
MGAKMPPSELFLSVLLGGVNMGWLRNAVKGCPLAELFKRSKRGTLERANTCILCEEERL